MFRKGKKNSGNVTVFDDDDEADRRALLGTSKGGGNDDFGDLGLSSPAMSHTQGGMKTEEEMSMQELEDLAVREAMQGREGTQRALEKARDARGVGIDTASKLHAQTQQLEKMSEDIEVVHDYLDKGERLIEKMSKPKIARMFMRSKGKGKHLEKAKGSKKQKAKREELKRGGVAGLGIEEMRAKDKQGEAVEMEELERNELLGGKAKGSGSVRRGRKGKNGNIRTANYNEDYSQYSTGVATALKEQDKDLDEISAALGDMKGIAEAMDKELAYQEGMIEQVGTFTTKTAVRTKENVRRVNKILK